MFVFSKSQREAPHLTQPLLYRNLLKQADSLTSLESRITVISGQDSDQAQHTMCCDPGLSWVFYPVLRSLVKGGSAPPLPLLLQLWKWLLFL